MFSMSIQRFFCTKNIIQQKKHDTKSNNDTVIFSLMIKYHWLNIGFGQARNPQWF